jgi:ABC-type uncharacterized transport system permease subunit
MDATLQIAVLSIVPLIFLAMAGLVPWVSGVLVVSLEGFMLLGAFVGAVAGSLAHSQAAGFATAGAAGCLAGALVGCAMIYFRADQVVTGIAFNIAMLGATSFLYAVIETRQGALTAARAEPFNVPLLSDLPGVGVLFSQHWFVPFGPLLVVAVWYLVYRTGVGLRLRACGDFAAGAHASGVNVGAYRFWAVVASGALAGLAGAFLSLVVVQSFTENMTAGRGYIALTIVILGRWRPVGVALGAVLFAFAEGVSVVWQGRWGLPSQFFLSVPYLLTLLAVAASARASTAPREEGRPLTVRS